MSVTQTAGVSPPVSSPVSNLVESLPASSRFSSNLPFWSQNIAGVDDHPSFMLAKFDPAPFLQPAG